MSEHEHMSKEAFERMYVCGNKKCPAYGDDTPDWAPNDARCLMCATTKVHWTAIPEEDLNKTLRIYLKQLELVD